jgi:O-antigen/teichoic acid export membrane protein
MDPDSTVSRRVLKTLAALLGGQGIQTLTQFFLPPVFLAVYGVNGYGEWLVLSAAVGYLSALDFGLQNYVPNQLTMLYHQGRLEDCQKLQSTGLRIMAGFLGAGLILSSLVFLLPVERWLELGLAHRQAALCLFLLATQILALIGLGQLGATFRVFGQAHRGVMWGNVYRLVLLGATLGLVGLRGSFAAIALVQLLVVVGAGWLVLRDLRRQAPALMPTWGIWDGDLGRTVIRQSGFFALFTLNNFLLYQLPLLAINRVCGRTEVVAFSVARMLFSSARQLAALIQGALIPEIGRFFGLGDQPGLRQLHRLTESAVLSVVGVVNVALLLCSPVLLEVWLRQPALFDLRLYVLMMAVGVTISIKDYKLYFQYATNTYVRASLVTSAANAALALLLVPSLNLGGIAAFTALWLALEVLQLGPVHGFNDRVLGDPRHNSPWPAVKLVLLLAVATGIVVYGNLFWRQAGNLREASMAAGCVALLAFGLFFLFDLRWMLQRISRAQRSAPA